MTNSRPDKSSSEIDSGNSLASKSQPWTDETVSLFWKYDNTKTHADSTYFSYHYGLALIALAKELGLFHGQVLDYSAARGHLTNQLLDESSVTVEAVEYTDEAVNALNRKFQNRPRWNKASVLQDWLLKPRQYDLIFCIEVIEHLIDPHLETTFQDLYNSLKPGGAVLFTTPNEEPLESHFSFCPFCRTEFHPVQHVHTFSKESLTPLLEDAGFEVKYCHGVNLNLLAACLNPNSWKMSRYNYLTKKPIYRYLRMMDAIIPGKKSRLIRWIEQDQSPHLLAIAFKPLSSQGTSVTSEEIS